MREIDLIPASYRRERMRELSFKVLAAAVAVLIAGTAAGRVWLDTSIGRLQNQIAGMQAQQTISTQERDQLAALSAERDDYRQQLYLLKGLRSGTAASNLFGAIDEALVGQELWFRDWQFRRAGVTNAQGQTIETGYFIVVPETGQPAEPWQVETHMTIAGQALDHEALSEFVRRLLARHEIASVRIRRTELQRYESRTIVDFDLAIVINREVFE